MDIAESGWVKRAWKFIVEIFGVLAVLGFFVAALIFLIYLNTPQHLWV